MNFPTNRNVTLLQTRGVTAMELPEVTTDMLFRIALDRYVADSYDYFTVAHAAEGDSFDITNGNGELIATESAFLYPGIYEDVWLIVDDYGPNSKEGLVVTILLPEEY